MQGSKPKAKDIGELNGLYEEYDTAAQELFAEQRNNLYLVNGQHYNKRGSTFYNRVRDSQTIPQEQKLRLVKNHIGRIVRRKRNNIIRFSPGVTITPKNGSELQDVEAADQHNSVWTDIKVRHKLKDKKRELIDDFCNIGEMVMKVGFDYEAGRFIGYKEVTGPDGNWLMDETGEPLAEPIFSGDHTYERVFGFNVLSDPNVLTFGESPCVIIRKMVVTKDLRAKIKDEELAKKIVDTQDERYKVAYGEKATQKNVKGQTMVREYYFRKCAEYPNGYFFITACGQILFQGELPLGIFPIIYAGYDEMPTFPRAYSPIKPLRPYQAEINRTASKIAEHQITLGDDKLVLVGGSKIAHGGTAHGVKAINVTGAAPTHIPGRSGEQFVPYMQGQISEMYQVADEEEDDQESAQADQDPWARLYQAAQKKKKYSVYTSKVEAFERELADVSLRFAKEYYNEDMLVPAVGKKELVNIAEFKDSDDLSTQIVVEAADDDIDAVWGRQLAMNHAIQFVGPQLDRSDVGVFLKNMPYGNKDGAFDDLTMNSENAKNDLLALDRGKMPMLDEDADCDYLLKKLTNRIKKADFDFLPPQIRMNYKTYRQQVRGVLAKQQSDAQKAQAGFIPTGGYLVGCDFFVEVGGGKAPKRARVPYEALNWLMQKLDAQGTSQKSLNDQSLNDQAGIGNLTQPAVADQSVQPGGADTGANPPLPQAAMM